MWIFFELQCILLCRVQGGNGWKWVCRHSFAAFVIQSFFIVIQFSRYFGMGCCNMRLIALIGCFPASCVYSKTWKFLKKKKRLTIGRLDFRAWNAGVCAWNLHVSFAQLGLRDGAAQLSLGLHWGFLCRHLCSYWEAGEQLENSSSSERMAVFL